MLGALKTETLLETNHINAVVSLTDAGLAAWATMREYVPRDRHLILFVRILQHKELLIHMGHICEFIDHMLHSESPGAVLVHCEQGVYHV